ncbi:MAG: DsbE family thiol:disulfide interchange protein [Gammaproteobacteria bacterium]|nr:DsbE family thiol:disulfide interchange protein [Gammaproteobacteria bacterium]
MRLRLLLPLAVFALLVVFLGKGLVLNPSEVPSPLIDKAAPDFSLPRLHDAAAQISNRDMAGKVWMLNVWASWCVSCRQEHPLLVELSRRGIVPIYGLNYKDTRDEAVTWLRQLGNPYLESAFDADGRVGLDYGVYGVPETYVIDARGVIRYKQIGPINVDALQNRILPLIRELQGQA